MTSYQVLLLVGFVGMVALCWLKGGHSERLVATWVMIVLIAGDRIGRILDGDIWVDTSLALLLGGVLIRLCLTRHRWWLLAAGGAALLSVIFHLYALIVSGLDRMLYLSAQIGIEYLLLLTIVSGVVEHGLAGERPVSETARWLPMGRTGALDAPPGTS